MYTMKRVGFLLVFLAMSVFIVPYEAISNSPPSDRKLRIALLLWRGETEAEKGFKDRLLELEYQASFQVYNANQDIKNLGQHLLKLNSRLGEFDYIYTFGTTVSRRAKVIINRRVPQIFNIVTDPVGAGIVQSLDAPGENISGVSDAIPVGQQLDGAKALFDFKKLAILFNPREKNSMLIRKEMNRYSSENNIEILDMRCPPFPDVLDKRMKELKDISDEIDAVFLPPDSFMVSNSRKIGSYLREINMKSIGSIKTFIENGALIGVVGDYYHLGVLAANIVNQHRAGEPLETIPVRSHVQTTLLINYATATSLGVEIPEKLIFKSIGGP